MRGLVLTAVFGFCLISISLHGQQSSGESSFDYNELVAWAYGQDQELVNGMQYYNKHPGSMGHPYLLQGWAHQGSVTIRGRLYSPIWLKYDIHAQQVEVEYRTMNGAENQVILVGDRLDEFTIEKNFFRRLTLEEQAGEQFYQVLGEGRIILYIQWKKILVPLSGDSRFIEEYTPPKRDFLLELDASVYSFQNNKSFVKLFPKAIQKDLKRLLRSNYIRIRDASVEQLELLIMAASNLLKEVNG
ncbi:MAG: hypothetical protein P1P86_06970 [Bacteroidales bacterium]|nr:hypothetical protein [Bacteroidales bacterium]